MNEELFDVVNERDEVLGTRKRSDVHRLGLRHRAVHIVVVNRQGEVFLQKRSLKKDTYPGAWDSSASGHLEAGECYDVAALRELREELSLETLPPPARLFKVPACPETGQEFVWVYRVEAEGPFRWNPEEIEAGQWMRPEEITRRVEETPEDFASGFRLVWRRLLAEESL